MDNAGKTTLLKRLNGEDVGGTSPTLGFNIKTLEHRGCVGEGQGWGRSHGLGEGPGRGRGMGEGPWC